MTISRSRSYGILGIAQAYAGIANSYNLLSEFTLMPPDEAFAKAIPGAKKAADWTIRWPKRTAPLLFEEALTEIERAQQLNPAFTAILADKGLIHYYAGRRGGIDQLAEAD